MAYTPPPGQQYYPPYQPYQPYPPVRRTNGLAIAALVCGIGQFVTGVAFIPAIICGHLARREIRRTGEQGDSMALAGLILGYVGGAIFILLVLFVALLVTKSGSAVSVSHGSPAPPPAITGISVPAVPAPGN